MKTLHVNPFLGRLLQVRVRPALLVPLALLGTLGPVTPALPSPEALPASRSVLNRSVLTVEKRTYSLFEVELLLLLWNTALPEARVKLTTPWDETGGYFVDKKKSFLKNYEKWPADVQRLLFVTLSWPEVSHLSAYSTSEETRLALIEKARDSIGAAELSPATLRYLKATPPKQHLELADLVLRAIQSEKARGGMRESMGTISWFWHQRLEKTGTP